MVCIDWAQGALLFGLLRHLLVRLVRARSCCHRLSLVLQQMIGDRRVEWFPDASDDVSTLLGNAVPVTSSMFHMLLGHGLHRRRRGPWLYVPFRTDFRDLGARGQTSGSLSHTLEYGWVAFGRSHAFGTSDNSVFNLLVWPWPLSLILIIVGSWHRGQGARQNVETEIGWGKRGVLAGLCFARTARMRRPNLKHPCDRERWTDHERKTARFGHVIRISPQGSGTRSPSRAFGDVAHCVIA